jgi:hypothetical protein
MDWMRYTRISLAAGFCYTAIAARDELPHCPTEPTPPAMITLGLSAVTTTGTITQFAGSRLTALGDG